MFRIAATFIASTIVATAAFGFEIGETVVVVRDANLKILRRVVDKAPLGCALKIESVQGKWLWVNHGHPGWIYSGHVVRLDQAIPVLSEMIRKHPRESWRHGLRAEAWLQRKEYDKANADYKEALRLDPHGAIATATHNDRGICPESQSDFDQAIAEFIREQDKANADFDAARRLDPEFGATGSHPATAATETGEHPADNADSSEPLTHDGKNPFPYGNPFASGQPRYASAANDNTDRPAPLEYIERPSLELKGAPAFGKPAAALDSTVESDQPIADGAKYHPLDPQDAFSHVAQRRAAEASGAQDPAAADPQAALRQDVTNLLSHEHPNFLDGYSATAHLDSAIEAMKKGRDEEAIREFAEAIRIDPTDVYAYIMRGLFWEMQGDFAAAVEDYSEAIRIDPDYFASYHDLAMLRATCPDDKCRDGKQAIELATKACELRKWESPDCIAALAAAHAEAGDWQNAVQRQRQAVEMFTDEEDKRHGQDALELFKQKKPLRSKLFNANRRQAKAEFARGGDSLFKGDFDAAIERLTEVIRLAPNWAKAYAGRGAAWFEKREHDKAIEDFNEALRLDPQCAATYCLRGVAWQSKGEFDKAIADFTEALRLDPERASTYGARGLAWASKGENDKATADFDEALRLNPDSAVAHGNRAIMWLKLGEFDKALADCDEALRLEPQTVIGYLNRAGIWSAKGEHAKAITDLTEALRLDPTSADAYFSRGIIWKDLLDYDKAIADCTAALRLNPRDARFYNGRGAAWAEKGEADKAIADFDEALRLDPDYILAYIGRAATWRSSGEYDKAIADCTAALRLESENPGDHHRPPFAQNPRAEPGHFAIGFKEPARLRPLSADAYAIRGDCWHAKGEFDKAIADLDEFLLLDPKDAKGWRIRGRAWYAKGDFDKAIADYTEALRIDPGHSMAYSNRAGAWAMKGEYERAIADCTEAIRFDPTNSSAYYNRASARQRKGDYDNAIADLGELLKRVPNDAQAYRNRATLWCSKGEHDTAIADYSEAIQLDPDYAEGYAARGRAWYLKDDFAKAVEDLTAAIRLKPANARLYETRGFVLDRSSEYEKAIADFSEALRLEPDDAYAHRVLAWLLATCHDERFRNGARAVEHATKACELSAWKKSPDIDTLAAAYAESGDFAAAVKWQQKSIELTADAKKADYQSRLDLYKDGKPYREAKKK